MRLGLEIKENRDIVGAFPEVIEEIKNNIREFRDINEQMVSPNRNEQKIISANEKYIRVAEQILPFGEETLFVMQDYKAKITDNSAILLLLKGFIFYMYNRYNELNRIRKGLTNEKFFYKNSNKQIILSGLNVGAEELDSKKVEDLSYVHNNLYQDFRSFNADIRESTIKSTDASKWIMHIMQSSKYEKFPNKYKEEFTDLIRNAAFINKNDNMMNSIIKEMYSEVKKTKKDDEFRICQGLLANYSLFHRRLYTDCWAFKVKNDL